MSESLITAQAQTPDRVRQVALPPGVRALSMLSHVDYEDAFLVDVGQTRERTAEQWARAVMEDAPLTVRRTLQSGWTGIGLKLGGKPADRFVLGWEIRRNTPELVLLGADSWVGMPAELLFKREQHTLLCATLVQHNNQAARLLWAGVEPVHVPVVRRVLEQASRRCSP